MPTSTRDCAGHGDFADAIAAIAARDDASAGDFLQRIDRADPAVDFRARAFRAAAVRFGRELHPHALDHRTGAAIPYPYGGKQRQVQVDLDTTALQAKGLSPLDVVMRSERRT